MKRLIPVCGLLIACIITAGVGMRIIAAQERYLFKQTDPRDTKLPKKTDVASDTEAIQAWWRESFGDSGPKLRIIEMKPRAKPVDFEVKIKMTGEWENCADLIGPLAKEATATIAKIEGSSNGKKDIGQYLFIIRHGEVVYADNAFRKL